MDTQIVEYPHIQVFEQCIFFLRHNIVADFLTHWGLYLARRRQQNSSISFQNRGRGHEMFFLIIWFRTQDDLTRFRPNTLLSKRTVGEIAIVQGVRFIPSSPLLPNGPKYTNGPPHLPHPIYYFLSKCKTPSINRNLKKLSPPIGLSSTDISALAWKRQ